MSSECLVNVISREIAKPFVIEQPKLRFIKDIRR
jgi:hypothetical protein